MITVNEIKDVIINHTDFFEQEVCIKGWIRTYRKQSELCFMNINDGSEPMGIQVISRKKNNVELFESLSRFNTGCYIKLRGNAVKTPDTSKEFIEIELLEVLEEGLCDKTSKYPLKKNTSLEKLRSLCHLRARTKVFGSIFRIRNTLSFETHRFFQTRGYLHLDPNVITVNECEGGAGVFQLNEWCPRTMMDLPIKDGYVDYTKDHFKRPAYLTVSSQLQLEALACGMGNVYTTNKSFRSEHSSTNKHVSEFTHLEIESIDCTNDDIMNIGEDFITHIIQSVYEQNYNDLEQLNKFVCKGILSKYEEMLSFKFHKIKYVDAIDFLNNNGNNVLFGADLSSEMENDLCKAFGGPVFVTDWPFRIKSFYMKQNDDAEETCECFDLLMPYGIGEMIGGSMREHRYEALLSAMEKKEVPTKDLEWYLDLRRYGTVKHGGFGLGLDRLLMMVTGIQNIKDVIPFPVYYQSCGF